MATQIKPSQIAGIYKPSKLEYKVKPLMMKTFQSMFVKNNTVQTLNEAPIADKIYSYGGKNYGRPQFELLPNDVSEGGVHGLKGFQFTKDNEDVLHLNIIIKAFHPQANVIPLDFRTITLEFRYSKNGETTNLPLQVKQLLPINKMNELKHIYAHAIIKEEDKEAVYQALVSSNLESKLSIKAEVWWQKPNGNVPSSRPNSRPVPTKPRATRVEADVCSIFIPNHLSVRDNTVYHKGQVYMKFRNSRDAQKAVRTIRHYKMDRKCSVGSKFTYYLSGANPPVGKINGEHAIAFNASKLRVKAIGGRWKIMNGHIVLFDFGTNQSQATKALKIIKKHGFDAVCYIGRPNPGMTYLKRTKPFRLQMFRTILQPSLINFGVAQPAKPQTSKPQKIDINSDHILLYEPEDASVFQGFFNELESKEYKWQHENKIEGDDINHSYYYRLTNDPKKVFFLPQVYRIGVNHDTGEPKLYLNLYEHESENGHKEYRINMNIHIEPYYHPSAKKDLMIDLYDLSKGNIKYVENLVLGGYQNVSFEVEERFLSDKSLFSQKITETLTEINPSGFTITADHSLESFEAFKRELITNGINLGKIFFDLEEETQEGVVVKKSRPINVELNFKKLKNIPIEVEKIGSSNTQLGHVPSGFYLRNKTSIPITVEDVELTMISTDNNLIYDVDYDLKTTGVDWPLKLETGKKEGIFIDQEDIEELSVENMVWNKLVCEPYGMRADIDPEKIMASVIDRATGDSEMWHLNISSPLFENWDTWSEEEKESYKKIMGVLVEIRRKEGDPVGSYELNRNNPRLVIQMSSTVQQMLQSSNQDNKTYEYRQTNISLQPSAPGEWKTSESTGVEHLFIYPKIEQ